MTAARARAALAGVLVTVLAGGCSLIEDEPQPAVEHGLHIPSSEELAAAVDDAAEVAVWGETTVPASTAPGEAPPPTAPPSTGPPTTTVDPRHAFAQAAAAICREQLAIFYEPSEPETMDEKVETMRAAARAFQGAADGLAGLTAPDPTAQGHLDEAVRLFRRAGELMASLVDTALQGDAAGVDAIQAEMESVLGEITRAVTAAGIPSCR